MYRKARSSMSDLLSSFSAGLATASAQPLAASLSRRLFSRRQISR